MRAIAADEAALSVLASTRLLRQFAVAVLLWTIVMTACGQPTPPQPLLSAPAPDFIDFDRFVDYTNQIAPTTLERETAEMRASAHGSVLVFHPFPSSPAVGERSLRVDSAATRLDFSVRGHRSGDFLARVVAVPAGGVAEVLWEGVVAGSRGWIRQSVDIGRFQTRNITLRFEAHATGWSFEYGLLDHFVVVRDGQRLAPSRMPVLVGDQSSPAPAVPDFIDADRTIDYSGQINPRALQQESQEMRDSGQGTVLVFHPFPGAPAVLERNLIVDSAATRLDFSVRGHRAGDFLARIVAAPAGGASEVLWEEVVVGSRGWLRKSIDLGRFNPRQITLRFEAHATGWHFEYGALDHYVVLRDGKRLPPSGQLPLDPRLADTPCTGSTDAEQSFCGLMRAVGRELERVGVDQAKGMAFRKIFEDIFKLLSPRIQTSLFSRGFLKEEFATQSFGDAIKLNDPTALPLLLVDVFASAVRDAYERWAWVNYMDSPVVYAVVLGYGDQMYVGLMATLKASLKGQPELVAWEELVLNSQITYERLVKVRDYWQALSQERQTAVAGITRLIFSASCASFAQQQRVLPVSWRVRAMGERAVADSVREVVGGSDIPNFDHVARLIYQAQMAKLASTFQSTVFDRTQSLAALSLATELDRQRPPRDKYWITTFGSYKGTAQDILQTLNLPLD